MFTLLHRLRNILRKSERQHWVFSLRPSLYKKATPNFTAASKFPFSAALQQNYVSFKIKKDTNIQLDVKRVTELQMYLSNSHKVLGDGHVCPNLTRAHKLEWLSTMSRSWELTCNGSQCKSTRETNIGEQIQGWGMLCVWLR